jgi:hypothetical protein
MEEEATNTISIDEAIEILNGLIELARSAMMALISTRVPCNEALANHPTVQVHARGGYYSVGFLGILNGMFGVDEDGWGLIMATIDDEVGLIKFSKRV